MIFRPDQIEILVENESFKFEAWGSEDQRHIWLWPHASSLSEARRLLSHTAGVSKLVFRCNDFETTFEDVRLWSASTSRPSDPAPVEGICIEFMRV